jgi:peptide/nickel transport system substrate-binding protein
MIELNCTIPPFDKKEVRQAVAYATPYQDILDQIYLGQAGPAKSLVPTGMPTSDGSTNKYALDLDKAKQLLAAGGYPDGNGLPEIKLTISADDVQREAVAILMKDSLGKIGMNVTIEKLPYAQYNQLEQSSQLQMWTDEWISWVNDPYYHLFWLAQSTSPSNYPKFKSDRIDELITSMTLAPASAERDAGSKEMQAILIEESPYILLCQPNWIVYFRKDIQGYVYYNDELPRYYQLSRAAS